MLRLSLFFRFLGSMNLAIMLLLIIAVAAIIGTILAQNKAHQYYLFEFGPLWHQIYQLLGLYDIYSSGWFLALLFFLIISVMICLIRHGPLVIRQIYRHQDNISATTIYSLRNHAEFHSSTHLDQIKRQLRSILTQYCYRVRMRENKMIATKGISNRLGYFFTHISIVIICAGSLLDSKIKLKWMITQGDLAIRYNDSPVAAIPAQSRLGSDTTSFRGNVMLPEGKAANFCFVSLEGGFVLQELPFMIELKSFRIAHYSNGQPKSFESDLVIHDPATKERIEQTIRVNHPLRYQGYTIYQSSFSDGGSLIEANVHPLRDSKMEAVRLTGVIKDTISINTPKGLRQLELTGFRKFNVFRDGAGGFIDHGPSLEFKLTNNDGNTNEFQNYMYPVQVEGRYFMLSSIQSVGAEDIHYLYIPVDQGRSLQRFFDFYHLLFDDVLLDKIAQDTITKFFLDYKKEKEFNYLNLSALIIKLVQLFREGGLDSIEHYVEGNVAEQERKQALAIYLKLLQFTLEVLYNYLPGQHVSVSDVASDAFDEQLFFKDAINTFSLLYQYDAPVYITLEGYQHKQASGLQVAKTPGAKWIFLGFCTLIVGIFLLFYVSYQRLWLMLIPQRTDTTILIGGLSMHSKNNREFLIEFANLCEHIKRHLQ